MRYWNGRKEKILKTAKYIAAGSGERFNEVWKQQLERQKRKTGNNGGKYVTSTGVSQ